jgi:hypothetical protein
MFDRAAASLIATTTACAAAALAVFAAGFALYALVQPALGAAGAAAAVATASAALVGIYALIAHFRAKEKEREAELAQAQLLNSLPLGLGGVAREHPMVALAVTLLGGVVAARHPRLSRDLLAIVARFTGR